MFGLPRRPSEITATELQCVLFSVSVLAKYEVILFENTKKKNADSAAFHPPLQVKVGGNMLSEIGELLL